MICISQFERDRRLSTPAELATHQRDADCSSLNASLSGNLGVPRTILAGNDSIQANSQYRSNGNLS
jgi:hypothetical protein